MDILTVVIVAALLATSVPLILGIRSMAHGGEFDRTHSTHYMALRVGLQAVTFALLAFALFVKTF